MYITEVIAFAKADAALAIEIARSSIEPVEFITGNSHMPPLRAFGNADRVWQSDSNDGGDLFTLYEETFEKALEAANVYLACPPDDNSLYVVDMDRWEAIDDPDESETLSGEWRPITDESETAAILADPDTMGAIAEAEAELNNT